jgi:outer membrane biosynthesis protein TonB
MSNITTDAEKTPAAAQPSEPETKPKKATKGAKPAKKAKATKQAKPAKKTKPAKKAKPAKKGGDSERSNKKAEVIAMMRRAKGVTLAEIMKVTGWQRHTVRGFVSILGSKGGETIESSKSAAGDRTYRITK